jgi:hypothetical protein
MPNMQYVNRLIEDDKKKTISPSVARAEKQFANRLIKRRALRSQRTTFRTPRQAPRTLACPPNPLPRRNRRLPADITISCPEIALGCGRDNHPVNHLAGRVFPFQFVKHFIHRSSRPFVRLR